jgi:hypothetical protein
MLQKSALYNVLWLRTKENKTKNLDFDPNSPSDSTSNRNPQVDALLSKVKAVGGKVTGLVHSRSALLNQIHGLILTKACQTSS